MKIAIDLDGTINSHYSNMRFFFFLTSCFRNKCPIIILTNRDPGQKSRQDTINELKKLDIYYDELVITANKAKYIIENNITVFFEDTDEYFLELPESILVLKVREAGNFDFSKKKWIYGNKTGINID